jgi:hypothetical protein
MMSGHWIFEHHSMLDPDWRPAPGQTWRKDAPKALCKVTCIRGGRVHFRYLDQAAPRSGPFTMSLERWREMGPAERQCPDCEDWDTLVETDCCEGVKFDCRTQVLLDGAGDPDVRVCSPHHGCNRGAYAG